MIPAKDKAEEIFDKMLLDWGCNECHNHWAKDCALIAVDELIKETGSKYWYDVKQEIEKL